MPGAARTNRRPWTTRGSCTLPDKPTIERQNLGGLRVHTDTRLRVRHGITVAFTERTGGTSESPYASLNLAAHVGDDPDRVDANRDCVLEALQLGDLRGQLVTAEQVHCSRVRLVDASDAGSGAYAATGRPPLSATDALITEEPGLPLIMLYADCVPVVMVVVTPFPAIAIVHAGWRGALAGIVGKAARSLIDLTGAQASDILSYIGPHIGACCYEVDAQRISQFRSAFATISAVGCRLDLGAVVREQLASVGVLASAVACVDSCTSDQTDRFFSYRASGVTGRHAALGAIAKGD